VLCVHIVMTCVLHLPFEHCAETSLHTVTYSGVLFTMELYCTPKFNTQLLITNSSTPNTTGVTSLFRSQNTTNSSSIEVSLSTTKHATMEINYSSFTLLHNDESKAIQYCCVAKERNSVALVHCFVTGTDVTMLREP
jgi:hypothetical protein